MLVFQCQINVLHIGCNNFTHEEKTWNKVVQVAADVSIGWLLATCLTLTLHPSASILVT